MDDPDNQHTEPMGDDSDAPVQLDTGTEASAHAPANHDNQPTDQPTAEDVEAEANAESEGMPPPEVAQAEQQMATAADPAQSDEPTQSDEPVQSDTSTESEAPSAQSEASSQSDDWMDTEGDVRAQNVSINQGGARDVYASTVTISQGGAGQVRADKLTVSLGGVGTARTQELNVEQGGFAFGVSASNATVSEGGSVLVLLARSVTGDVRPLLDWRSALALGAGFAVVRSLLSGKRRRRPTR